MAKNALKPSRRWLQFSLRGYLIFIAVLCLCLSPHAERAMRQRRLLAAMHKVGGWPHFNCVVAAGGILSATPERPCGPISCRRILGDEFFRTVTMASFSGGLSTIEFDLVADDMLDVRGLLLGNCCFTDEGWRRLAGLSRLESLDLRYCNVRGPELRNLADLSHLRSLNLGNTNIDDAGLRYIARLNTLENINLESTLITQAGFERLRWSLPAAAILWDQRRKGDHLWFDDPDQVAIREARNRLSSE